MLSSLSTMNSLAKFQSSTGVAAPTQSWGSSFAGSIQNTNNRITRTTMSQTIGTGKFTIEFWMYAPSSSNGVAGIFGISAYDSNSNSNGRLTCFYNFPGITGRLMLQTSYNANLEIISNAIPTNQWVHVAITRNASNVVKIYVNGVASTFTQSGITYPSATWNYNFNNGRICLFRDYYDLDQEYFIGSVTGFSVSKDIWYTSNFTPNTSTLNNDTSKILLLNATSSGAILTDSSSSNNTLVVYTGNAQTGTMTYNTSHP